MRQVLCQLGAYHGRPICHVISHRYPCATAAAFFQPILGQPSDDDLTALRDILYLLLLDIPYMEYAVNDLALTAHNLVGLIEPIATYTA